MCTRRRPTVTERSPDRGTAPDRTARAETLQELASIFPLPAGLTLEKISERGWGWETDADGFRFRMERHPTGLITPPSPASTPARWHVDTEYVYDRAAGEWAVIEHDREFRFDPMWLIHYEFDELGKEEVWRPKIEAVRTAEDAEAALTEEFAPVAEVYRDAFPEAPEEEMRELLEILEEALRRRAGLE